MKRPERGKWFAARYTRVAHLVRTMDGRFPRMVCGYLSDELPRSDGSDLTEVARCKTCTRDGGQ